MSRVVDEDGNLANVDLLAMYQETGRIESVQLLRQADRESLIELKAIVESDIAIMKAQIDAGPREGGNPDWIFNVRTARGHRIGLVKAIEVTLRAYKYDHLINRNQRLCSYLLQAMKEILPEDLRQKTITRYNQICEEDKP